MAILHNRVVTAPDDGTSEVGSNEWNEAHVVSSLVLSPLTLTPAAAQNNYNPTGWDEAEPAKATTLALNPSASIVISGLAGGVSGRLAILRNTSVDRLIILPDESTDSLAANRFAIRNPVFLLPGASVTLQYDGASSRWRVIAASAGIGFGAFFDFFEDFAQGTIGQSSSAVAGTGASVQASTYLINTTERPLGVWQADTGTTATGRAHLGNALNNNLIPATGQAIFLTRLAVEALSTGTERFQVWAGLHSAVGQTAVADGIYWQYDDATSAAWQGATANNSVRTTTGAAGPTVDTNYIWLGLYVNPAWTRVTYFHSVDSINWAIAGELTTNIPTNARRVGWGASINKTIGTTQRNLSVDLLAFRMDADRG